MANDVIKFQVNEKSVELKVSTSKLILNGFLSGLAWGFGSVIGASLVVALILFLLSQLDTAPIIGKFIKSIIDSINNTHSLR
jgi:hypothetical protein